MRMSAGDARDCFRQAPVARLATADATGTPRLVPIVFALVAPDALCTVVDAKPKTTTALRRLADLRANPRASMLVDHYEDDWSQLWWARADGRARILPITDDEAAAALRSLTLRYPAYTEQPPPGPVIVLDVARWSGWRASRGAG